MGKKTDTAALVPPTAPLEDSVNRGLKKKKIPARHTFLRLRSATLWHKVKLPTISPNPGPVVRSKVQTLLMPSGEVLQARLPAAGALWSLRSPSPLHRRVRAPQPIKEPALD